MLNKLFVQNYALIESLEIDFSSGFSVITGETGAGKSVLLGAMSLILGERADYKVLFNKERKCIIEGVFDSNQNLNQFLNEMDVDLENEVIIRREITSKGKSRAFINDTPVKLDALKKAGSILVDIHGQHENLHLGESKYQYLFLDSAAKTLNLFESYQGFYYQYEENKSKLNQLLLKEEEMANKVDYINFQLKELEKDPIDAWDENEINDEYNRLSNYDSIKQLTERLSELSDGKDSITSKLYELQEIFAELVQSLPNMDEYYNRIKSVSIEMEDLFSEISKKDLVLDDNPVRLEELREKIMIMNSLMKKFNVVDLEELKEKKNELVLKLAEFENLSNDKSSLEHKLKHSRDLCLKKGKELFESRKLQVKRIEEHINAILSRLSMPNANIKIDLQCDKIVHQYGIEKLVIYISTNKGVKYHLINDLASGGELSRILLSMKSLISNDKTIPTMIFDEIDSGVSGKVANEIGVILKELSFNTQVICITHLPQVAAMGSFHYHVNKETDDQRTYTKIRLLENQERLFEIASMLGGEKPGKAAIDNAAELLN